LFSAEFMQMIRCPFTHSPLALAEQSLIDTINQQIVAGALTNRGGDPIERELDAGLINADRQWLFPVYDQIPQLIADEAVPIEYLDQRKGDHEREDHLQEDH